MSDTYDTGWAMRLIDQLELNGSTETEIPVEHFEEALHSMIQVAHSVAQRLGDALATIDSLTTSP